MLTMYLELQHNIKYPPPPSDADCISWIAHCSINFYSWFSIIMGILYLIISLFSKFPVFILMMALRMLKGPISFCFGLCILYSNICAFALVYFFCIYVYFFPLYRLSSFLMLTMCVAKPAEVGFCIYCCTQSLPTDTAHSRKIFPFLK